MYRSRSTTLQGEDSYSDTDSSVTIRNSPTNSSSPIQLDPDEVYFTRTSTTEFQEIVDLTGDPQHLEEGDSLPDEDLQIFFDNWETPDNSQPASPNSNASASEKLDVEEIYIDGILYRVGQSLELHDKTYLRVTSISTDANGTVDFFGRRLGRAQTHVSTYIPRWENELVWIVNETETVPLTAVKRFVKINFTNFCHIEKDQLKSAKLTELFCRLKEVIIGAEDAKYDLFAKKEISVEYLAFEEADMGFKFKPSVLRHAWRGQTHLFGDRARTQAPVVVLDNLAPVIDLTEEANTLQHSRQYTLGDAFCGAGGVSCGARKAGIHNAWAVDFSKHALETYGLNFPTTDCWQADVNSFLSLNHDYLRVDVLHGSPPCQPFSPAHTRAGRDDDANSACIFVSSNLVKKLKPRIYTMEETSGLAQQRQHSEILCRVILDFLEVGYSVRWSILNCVDYGVPQFRKRLVVIASGPGERLPPFPRPTHGTRRGLQPFTTIGQVISRIPAGSPDHDVQGAESRGIQRAPYDPNRQARCITTGGGDGNYHPSGLRGYTNRELACLQTFPLDYRFGAREVRKQIGNAVPPALAEALYREIIRSLWETDREAVRET
ncbi:C-5 cytosine methyltransferase DmtA [Aspergillus terreus]|uniref:Cytosine-specific methyltransferase n=1 Tax=Aspergillus terreus TaxID=33178 RepID=A0A5M3Z2Q6_ASPTE|nr:hypothetical protein ATETN484_0008023600 [Aspergillus terreus]GFF21137.1 C-5 cytosine methyltransferase DmtA [Aspergillus terreus]